MGVLAVEFNCIFDLSVNFVYFSKSLCGVFSKKKRNLAPLRCILYFKIT